MKYKLFSFILSFFLFSSAIADTNENYRNLIFNSYINGEMGKWTSIISQMEKETPLSYQNKTMLLEYYYGLIGHYLDKQKKAEAEATLKQADVLLKEMLKETPNSPLLKAIEANYIGFQIAISPMKAPFLFRGMVSNAKNAIKTGANNAFVNILYGNILLYMPEMFGGNKKEALMHYNQALKIMEQNPESTQNNWLYIQLIITIGLTNEKLEQYAQAKAMYERVMALQPNYQHVTKTLYPRLLAKMNT